MRARDPHARGLRVRDRFWRRWWGRRSFLAVTPDGLADLAPSLVVMGEGLHPSLELTLEELEANRAARPEGAWPVLRNLSV